MPSPFGPTSAETSRLGPMRAPKAPKPQNLKPPKPNAPAHSSADSFLLPLPYAAGTINQTAQSGYNADAALAKQNAALGYLTPDQQTARAVQQGTEVQGLYSNLANQIAGIQHVGVDQTNAGTAQLGAQNAAAGATGNPVASATGVANPGVTGNVGAQAVLASQGAGQGNFLGALQGSALASGTAGYQHAINAGQSNIQQDQASQQKTLAQLLSGIATPSARESTMATANQSARAANLQTALSQYQSGVAQQEYYSSLGEKKQAAAQGLANQRILAGITQQGETARTDATNQTRAGISADTNRTRAQIAKDNAAARVTAAKTTAAAKVAAAKKAAAAKGGAGATNKGYQVSYTLPETTQYDPATGNTKTVKAQLKTKPINAAVWQKYLDSGSPGHRKLSILGLPNKTKIRSSVQRS
jgi:hypothetical protein